jgi:hypothetical protein
MPETPIAIGKFSAEVGKQIVDALNSKGVSGKCPLCTSGVFNVASGFFVPQMVRDISEIPQIFGNQATWPCLAMACQNCGYTVWFSIAHLGLMGLFNKRTRP